MIDNGRHAVIDIAYFVAAILFIVGLKFLSSPARARRGNQIAARRHGGRDPRDVPQPAAGRARTTF